MCVCSRAGGTISIHFCVCHSLRNGMCNKFWHVRSLLFAFVLLHSIFNMHSQNGCQTHFFGHSPPPARRLLLVAPGCPRQYDKPEIYLTKRTMCAWFQYENWLLAGAKALAIRCYPKNYNAYDGQRHMQMK